MSLEGAVLCDTFACHMMGPLSGRLPRIEKVLVLSLIFVLPTHMLAQANDANQNQQSQPQTTGKKPVKPPPPPLFRRHRRGMYKNGSGVQVIDATPQSPPLEVDDPGVPDKGQYEINIGPQVDSSKPLGIFDFVLIDANYGVLPRIFGHQLPTQVKFEFPLAGAKAQGDPFKVGVGAAQFGLKFNFYDNEHTGLSFSFYPQVEFAIPGTRAVEKKLVDPGQTLFFPLLAEKEFRHVTLVANFGVYQPINDSGRATTGTVGLGLGRAITNHLALMAEIRTESAFDFRRDRLVVVNAGLMRRLRDNVILYANLGRSVLSDDGSAHTYAGAGVKFLFTPGKHSAAN